MGRRLLERSLVEIKVKEKVLEQQQREIQMLKERLMAGRAHYAESHQTA